MFQVRGQFDVAMDAKGRLPLPVRLRERLAREADPRLVLTAWDGGLQGFTVARWQKLELRFRSVSPFDPGSRAFLLAYVAGAHEVALDGQGRINVPPPLRRAADLSAACIVLSYLGTLEIWNPERLAARQADAAARLAQQGGPSQFTLWDEADGGDDL
jgi:MraZ protein